MICFHDHLDDLTDLDLEVDPTRRTVAWIILYLISSRSPIVGNMTGSDSYPRGTELASA